MLGTGSYTDVVTAVEELMAGEKASTSPGSTPPMRTGSGWSPPRLHRLSEDRRGVQQRLRLLHHPKLRGRYRSRSMDAVLAEARELSQAGVKELIVIAQDITRYGMDRKDGSSLAGLLGELCKLDFHWVRLHYLYPRSSPTI